MAGEGYSSSVKAALNTPSSGSGGFSAGDWSTMISGALKGGSALFGGQGAANKYKAKEMRRQTLANLLNQALAREFDIYANTKDQELKQTTNKMGALRAAANNFIKTLTG